jgi:hypothetical protein
MRQTKTGTNSLSACINKALQILIDDFLSGVHIKTGRDGPALETTASRFYLFWPPHNIRNIYKDICVWQVNMLLS